MSDPVRADLKAVRESFTPTFESERICGLLLERLSHFPAPRKTGILFSGAPGVGKSHLLRYVEARLAEPEPPVMVGPAGLPGAQPRKPLRSAFIAIPADAEPDPFRFVLRQLALQAEYAPDEHMPPDNSCEVIARNLADRSIGFVVVENVQAGPGSAQVEAGLFRTFVRALAARGILVVLVAGHGNAAPDDSDPMGDSCDRVLLKRSHLAEVISRTLTTKDAGQKQAVRNLLEQCRKSLPLLGSRSRLFVDLYPLHTYTFHALFRLRARLPAFSPLGFVRNAIEASRDNPADRMITQDVLFDHALPELREQMQFRPALDAYDALIDGVIPRLKSSVQPWTTALLKTIALRTLCSARAASVRSLANQLLIRDPADFLPSYALTTALLAELEQRGAALLEASGDKLDRSYRLPLYGESCLAERVRPEDLQLQFPLMLYDWIHSQIPSWNPELSPKYQRQSQSLFARIPEAEDSPGGVVYFKHMSDPLWSTEDLAALRESGAAWALLVLSPFDRQPDLMPAIRQLFGCWDRMIAWQPDIPTLLETDRLQRLAAAAGSFDPEERRARRRARTEAHRLMDSLYVERGFLIRASADNGTQRETITGSVSGALSRSLLAMVSHDRALPQGTRGTALNARTAIRWASLVSGMELEPGSGFTPAERSLLAWWDARIEVDGNALVAKLHALPESLLTTQLWDEIHFFESSLDLLKATFHRLKNREISLLDAMEHVANDFGNDEARVVRWRLTLENLAGLARWLPAFEHARDYILGAFPTQSDAIDGIRNSLLEIMSRPHGFITAAERARFDERFVGFKRQYADLYQSLHQEALGSIGSRVDTTALRNLELLSSLHRADRSWLERVRLIARWAQRNQCDLPVADILERYPRCYCNFVPAAKQHLNDPVFQINAIVQQGLEQHRAQLRNHSKTIIEGLKTAEVATQVARQIASILSHGPLIPLTPQSAEILNRVLKPRPPAHGSQS
jgi:hypothetical protein